MFFFLNKFRKVPVRATPYIYFTTTGLASVGSFNLSFLPLLATARHKFDSLLKYLQTMQETE